MPESPETDSEYITPGTAQSIAFLSTKQLSRLADEGRIRYIRPGKHRRYLRSDVESLVKREAA
ncbi:MAG TPA: helix-turn-helix domain-containing protein [Pseudoclavibacter sp.]|nr:helix-turn-helix domain-containing protein [Pseudoclavibacter sp.]